MGWFKSLLDVEGQLILFDKVVPRNLSESTKTRVYFFRQCIVKLRDFALGMRDQGKADVFIRENGHIRMVIHGVT